MAKVTSVPDDEFVPGLSVKVIGRMRSELPERAEKIVRCLRTAAVLIDRAEVDADDLRLAESAAYNIREALNAVVADQEAHEGGLTAVLGAWREYKAAATRPGTDTASAREALEEVLTRIEADEERASYYARKLLAYLAERSGISPLKTPGDPVAEYGSLRRRANSGLHNDTALPGASELLARTIQWLVRVFTPPDDTVTAIRALARQPWHGQAQIAELKRLATDNHHLRLFFTEVTDPAWLVPLRTAGIAGLPSPQTLWPVTGLLDGLARTHPDDVAALLGLLLKDVKQRLPKDNWVLARFELLRIATRLGPAGRDVVAAVAQQDSTVPGVRAFAVSYACGIDPTDPVVVTVARAIVQHLRRFGDGDLYHATQILDQLQEGVTAGNIADRARMLAAQVRERTNSAERWYTIDVQALTADPGERPEPLMLLAHHLVGLLRQARQVGVSTSMQMQWLEAVSGELGERLRCQALAGADDVPLNDKIAHIAVRLESSTATGDDLALVDDIQAHNPAREDLTIWAEAWGTPSAGSADEDQLPEDWCRAWRWSAVLPDHVLETWREPIDHVTHHYEAPDPTLLTREHAGAWSFSFVQSPYTSEHLASLTVDQAAELVAHWHPDPPTLGAGGGPLELARALQQVVQTDPARWAADPEAVVRTLREPIYVEHYFRGLTETITDVVPLAAALLTAATQASDRRAPAEVTASVENGLDRRGLDSAILDLISALAIHDGDIAGRLDQAWDWALKAIQEAPEVDDGLPSAEDDPTIAALNRLWGRGLRTVLALATWEFRQNGTIRDQFEHCLDAVTERSDLVGLEFRAILVLHLPLLAGIAQPWLDAHADGLFRRGALARPTLDLAVQAGGPPMWTYDNLAAELFDAARRNVDNAAGKIATATLHEYGGYDFDQVIRQLRTDSTALAAVADSVTFQVQGVEPGSPLLSRALGFWTHLLDSDRTAVPGGALVGLGRWAFVSDLDNDRWAQLTLRTLKASNGRIDYSISVTDRAATIPPNTTSRQILLYLLDNGEPWERYHAAQKALEVLRATTPPADDSAHRLRTRLIDLGYHDATDITFDETD
jgi:hypothetical protein